MKKKLFLSLLPFVALALSSCFNGAPGGNTNPNTEGGGGGGNTDTQQGGGGGGGTTDTQQGGGGGGNTDTTTDTTTETDTGLKFYVGSTAYTLSEDAVEPDLQQWIDHKYSYTGFSVFEDDVIKFTLDGVELSVFSNPEDAANFNNTKEAPGQTPSVNWTVHNTTSGAAIYLQHNVDNGGSYSFWLTGGTARGETPVDPPVGQASYSIVKTNGDLVVDLIADGQDYQQRDQFKGYCELKVGDEIQLKNNETGDTWIPPVDGWSFGGASSTDETWKTYLELGEGKWTVLKDCNVDIYAKFAWENDEIYFGLVGSQGGGSHEEEHHEESNYALRNPSTNNNIQMLLDAGVDPNNIPQLEALNFSLQEGEEFALYDLNEEVYWVCDIESGSFGGNTDAYLEISADKWTVKQACTVNVYVKLSSGSDSIYFGLVGESTDPTEPTTQGFALVKADGTVLANLTKSDEPDFQGRDQYSLSGLELKAGDVIQLSNLDKNEQWIAPVEGWSFGGESNEDETWKTYLSADATAQTWTVLQDCTVDISAKFSLTVGDSIYFGLSSGQNNPPLTGDVTGTVADEDVTFAKIQDAEGDKLEKWSVSVDLKAGDEIVIKVGGVQVNLWRNPEDETNISNVQEGPSDKQVSKVTVLNDATEATIFVQKNPDNSVGIWVTGYDGSVERQEQNQTAGYYLVGTMNNWQFDEDYLFVVDPTNSNKYTLTVTLAATDEFKVNDGKDWFGNDSTWDNCGFTLEGNDKNISVNEAGEYTIEFYVEGDNNNHIVPVKSSSGSSEPTTPTDPVDPSDPTATEYTLTFTNVDYGTVQGQGLFVTGQFAGWAAQEAYRLTPNGTKWSGEFTLPAGTEYKLIVAAWEGGAATVWQPDAPSGGNYVLNENTTVTAW